MMGVILERMSDAQGYEWPVTGYRLLVRGVRDAAAPPPIGRRGASQAVSFLLPPIPAKLGAAGCLPVSSTTVLTHGDLPAPPTRPTTPESTK